MATLASPLVEALPHEIPPTLEESTDPMAGAVSNQPTSAPAATIAVDNEIYCTVDLQTIKSVADEAKALFPVGKQFSSPQDLREGLRKFGHKKGFEITSTGNKYTCTRCDEPNFRKKEREKRSAVPAHKQRKRISTRVGCQFRITYSFVDWKNQGSKGLQVLPASNFRSPEVVSLPG